MNATTTTEIVAMPGQAIQARSPADIGANRLWQPIFSVPSDSGQPVSWNRALGHGPLWQGVNILAGDIGQIPLHKMRRDMNARSVERDWRHPADRLVAREPNDLQTPSLFKETLMLYALLWGNGIAYIDRAGRTPIALMPLLPDRTGFRRLEDGSYMVTTRLMDDRWIAIPPEDTLHIRGLAANGFWGLSLIEIARNVIGHGLALQQHGNSTFRNGAVPGGVLKHPGQMQPEDRANLRADWQAYHGGSENAGSTAVLWDGMSYEVLGMSNEDAQWLEAMRLDRESIASLLNLPAFKLNAQENSATRSNIEEQNRDYFNTSLARWATRFVEECYRKLLTAAEQASGEHYFRFETAGLYRADIKTRYDAYMIGRTGEWLSVNDIRLAEDMSAIDGGDRYANPAINPQMTEADARFERTVRAQCGALLTEESRRLTNALRSKSPALAIGDIYQGQWSKLCSTYLAGLGGPWRRVADDHCEKQRQSVTELLVASTPDDLADEIAKHTASFPNVADALAASFMGAMCDV